MPDGPYFTRRALLVGGAAALAHVLPARAMLEVRNRDEQISVAAPDFHFLSGRTLDRLHDGHTIGFEFQLGLALQPKGSPFRRALERFLISFDLWEEKFSVTRVRRGSRPVTDLTAGEAEAWCLDHVMVPASELSREVPFWVRLDVRAEDASGVAKSDGEGGFDLAGLVDIFSRPGRDKQARWSLESGPVQLGTLAREESRR